MGINANVLNAEGSRAVISVTDPTGRENPAINQWVKGGFDGTKLSYAGGEIQFPVDSIPAATSASLGSPLEKKGLCKLGITNSSVATKVMITAWRTIFGML
jgi:hypothetical protein